MILVFVLPRVVFLSFDWLVFSCDLFLFGLSYGVLDGLVLVLGFGWFNVLVDFGFALSRLGVL